MAGVALIASGDVATAARLGASMTALQCSIGALNDLVDAPADAGHKPGKPIPRGWVSTNVARVTVVVGAVAGVGSAVASGWALGVLAVVVLGIGYAYDLGAKGTAWSWLPFAIGIPILPVYGWFGGAGTGPAWLFAMLPVATLIGASIAIANARADVERDQEAGVGSVAVRLGLTRSWWVGSACLGIALLLAVGWLVATDQADGTGFGVVLLGSGMAVTGALVARVGSAARRERGWQVLAVGDAVVGVSWVWLAAT